jgi:hypothetical protein
VKTPRGAYGIVPLLASVTTKYGLETPRMNGDALLASFAHVQALDSLLIAADEAATTAYDAHFIASSQMWSSFRMLYAMLSALGQTNAELANDLKPIVEWFGSRTSPAKGPSEPSAAPSG